MHLAESVSLNFCILSIDQTLKKYLIRIIKSCCKRALVAWREVVFWMVWPTKRTHRVANCECEETWYKVASSFSVSELTSNNVSSPKQQTPAAPTTVRSRSSGLCNLRLSVSLRQVKCFSWDELSAGGHSVMCYTMVSVCPWQPAAGNIINMLWQLMENGLEELKLLQTVLVLLTTNTVVHDEVLSKVQPRLTHAPLR